MTYDITLKVSNSLLEEAVQVLRPKSCHIVGRAAPSQSPQLCRCRDTLTCKNRLKQKCLCVCEKKSLIVALQTV